MDNITKQNGNEVGRHQVEGQTIIINQQERRSTNGLGTAGFIGLVGFDFQLGSGARLGIVGLGFDFFIRGNFQNSPRLGDRRACHIVYRVDRFDYLGECDRFPGVIISVGMKKEYPVQKDTLSYIAMFETLISPVFQFRYSLSNGERSL